MRFTYAYKTSDGARHEASMSAASREAVFEALRAKGIRPIKVVAADGSKANGEVRGVRKRAVAALVLLAAIAAAAIVAYFDGSRSSIEPVSSPRHQIYGDPAIITGFEHGDFERALKREGDRLLARFAQPGEVMCAKNVDWKHLSPVELEKFVNYVRDELASSGDLKIEESDCREVRELKQIVNGMREEMREYLDNGNGTPRSYWRRLTERTVTEIQIYERTRRELENETSDEVWEQKNDALRRLGIRTIPNSNE
ncbi:MAG: hypothetical protein IJH50_06990 [Kiritimatiellae bacterium]|nr:hypothetical protein [Kiritimatiellia bacterium]